MKNTKKIKMAGKTINVTVKACVGLAREWKESKRGRFLFAEKYNDINKIVVDAYNKKQLRGEDKKIGAWLAS
jgi:hypothetical protein